MIVKIICYLSAIVHSFITNLDAINFFAPFSYYADDVSNAFPSFDKI